MRLLKLAAQGQLTWTKDLHDNIPPYAILSHTWGADEDEVTFEDLNQSSFIGKAGYAKIKFCGEQATNDNLEYFWIDTCCINKANHTELAEAITSMFRWYRDAMKCYVYLSDVPVTAHGPDQALCPWEPAFRKSRWFTRGRTLQELLAPESVQFFAGSQYLGNKRDLEQQIFEITTIPVAALRGASMLEFSVQERLRWAEHRNTRKIEDKAYCLMGIFGVFMPLIYGEGNNALVRLRAKIELQHATQKSLNDLHATNPEFDMERIEQSKDKLLRACYNWVLDDATLRQWRDGNTIPLLWIKGDPGKGKTMLMMGLARELMTASSQHRNPVLVFFCQSTDPRLNTADAILRGLVWSLAMKDGRLADIFHFKYLSRANQLDTPNAIYALFTTLSEMLESCPGATVLIDGVDECHGGAEREQLLDLIVKHAKSSRTKWLLSSRNDVEIKRVLLDDGEMLSLELNEQHISNAVQTFITLKTADLAKQHSYSQELVYKIKEELFAKADSTFLWVSLACKRLARVSAWKALATLQDLPSGLDDLYLRMLDQVFLIEDKDDRCICLEILRSVTLAFRPLSIDEMFPLIQLPPEFEAQTLPELVDLCGSFVSIRVSMIYVVHQSAKDYLMERGAHRIFAAGVRANHGLMASRCLDIMSDALGENMCKLGHPGEPATSAIIDSRIRRINYVCSYWITHLTQYLSHSSTSGPDHQEWLSDQGRVLQFLREHLLHWIEALSVIGDLEKAIQGLYCVESLLSKPPQAHSPGLRQFINDAVRIFRQSRPTIEDAPLQIYTSALIFAPTQSVVRKTFEHGLLQWMSSLPRVLTEWKPCLQTLKGHPVPVNSVVFSPDGLQLASGADDAIRVWDAQTGKCLHEICMNAKSIRSVAFSQDGRHFVSGGNDGKLRFWNTQTWKSLAEVMDVAPIKSLALSSDGEQLASGDGDWVVRLWNVHTKQLLRELSGHAGPVRSVAFACDGRRLASGSGDGTIRLWDFHAGQHLRTLEHKSWIISVAFSPDGKQLVSGAEDGYANIWDTETGRDVRRLFHGEAVNALGFAQEGGLLAVGIEDGTVQLWDMDAYTRRQTFSHRSAVHSLAFSPGDQQLVSCGENGSIRLWDAKSKPTSQEPGISQVRGTASSFSRQDSGSGNAQLATTDTIASKYQDTRLAYDDSSLATAPLLNPHQTSGPDSFNVSFEDSCRTVIFKFSSGGRHLASSTGDSIIHLWHVHLGMRRKRLLHGNARVRSAAFSADAGRLASGDTAGTIRIWNVWTGRCLRLFHYCSIFEPAGMIDSLDSWASEITKRRSYVDAVVFSPDGKQLAAGAGNGTVQVWDVTVGNSLRTYIHEEEWRSLAWKDHRPRESVPESRGSLPERKMEDENKQRRFDICAAVFSPDGTRFASSNKAGTIKFWDVQTGNRLKAWYLPSNSIRSLCFSPDNSRLAVSGSHAIYLYDAATGQRQQEFGVKTNNMCFTTDGLSLETDSGTLDLRPAFSGGEARWTGFGTDSEGSWITFNGQKWVWIPPEFRPISSAVNGTQIGVLYETGADHAVYVLKF